MYTFHANFIYEIYLLSKFEARVYLRYVLLSLCLRFNKGTSCLSAPIFRVEPAKSVLINTLRTFERLNIKEVGKDEKYLQRESSLSDFSFSRFQFDGEQSLDDFVGA